MVKIKHGEKVHDQEKIQELEDQVKRTLADYQNLEKRQAEERKDWIKNSNKGLILRLLPALDTLSLASKHVEDEGLRLSIQQFQDALKAEGLERIETEGKHFDPKTMEAVEVQIGEEGKVIAEVRAGYLLNGEVLRPAQVKVGKREIDQKVEEEAKLEENRGDYT